MNAHLIRIVEGPLPGDFVAANDAVFDLPSTRLRDIKLTLVPAPAEADAAPADSTADNAAPTKTTEQDHYVLGGYAGI